jgi:hypothetical protein
MKTLTLDFLQMTNGHLTIDKQTKTMKHMTKNNLLKTLTQDKINRTKTKNMTEMKKDKIYLTEDKTKNKWRKFILKMKWIGRNNDSN